MLGIKTTNRPKPVIHADPAEQTFLEHITELRKRLAYVAATLVAGAVIGYITQDTIIRFLLTPLRGERLVYMTPTGGFDFIIKISIYVGLVLAAPVAAYQLYQFLLPLIRIRRGKGFLVGVMLLSVVMALSGILFGYFVIIPSSLHFLTHFAEQYVRPDITASSYIDFLVMHSLGLALLFQLPVLLICWDAIKPIKPSKLLKSEPFVVLGSVIAGGFLSPPDLRNQLLVVIPIFSSYQIGVAVVLWRRRYKKLSGQPQFVRSTTRYAQARMQVVHPTVAIQARPAQTYSKQPSPTMPKRVSIDGITPARRPVQSAPEP